MASKARAQANLLGSDGKIKATQFGTGSITSDFIDSDFTTSITTNPEFSGTEAARMPIGTTDQRASAQTGDIRFNSTLNLMEYYDGTLWKAIDSPPSITSISPEIFSAAGTTITITGSNFQSGVNVRLIDTDSIELTPDSVTLVSSSSITFDTTQAMVDNEKDKFDVRVVNVSGLSGTIENVLEISDGTFSFTNSATYTLYEVYRSSGFNAGGSISDGGGESDVTVSYAVTAGSLPSGGSINSSTGVITGISAVGSDTVSNFTVTATVTDASSAASTDYTRAFALTVKAPVVTAYSYTGSGQSFTPPAAIDTFIAYMWGAGGAGGSTQGGCAGGDGGAGGYVTATVTNFTSEQTFGILVGQSNTSDNATTVRSFGGGGNGGAKLSQRIGGAGGGRSEINIGTVNNTPNGTRILVAGGGGGGNALYECSEGAQRGGAGGGTTGESGYGSGTRPTGGTQSAGGSAGSGIRIASVDYAAIAGSAGIGGYATGGNIEVDVSYGAGGGGGGGYYGGGGGDGGQRYTSAQSGAGGSSYANPSYCSNITHTQGNGVVAPENGNTYYSSNVADGGSGRNGTGSSGTAGGNGRVVIVY